MESQILSTEESEPQIFDDKLIREDEREHITYVIL